MLDEIASKTVHRDKEDNQKRKRSKTLNKVPLENISKSLQIFLEISPMEKGALPSHKLQDHAYE